MDRILSHILQESGFAIESLVVSSVTDVPTYLRKSEQGTEGNSILVATCTTPGVDNHCLVLFVDKIPDNFVTQVIPGYSTALRDYLGERFTSSMPKNFSLIVCWKRESEASIDSMNPQILQIEEDPFDFKKYVLVYSKSEVDELHREWAQSQEFFIPFLNRFLYQEGKFTAFKNQTSPPAYNLVTQLFIKVPFLKLQVKGRSFENLQEVIRESMGGDLTNLLDRLLQVSPEDFMNELREMETNEQ